MKKIISCVIIALVFSSTALSSEYREFTNQDEKSIHARIVQYDAEGERVLLELQNHKKSWVQISDLSEEDQAYIQQYIQVKAKVEPEPIKELSKKELRAIGEQYIKAWESGDIESFKALFLQPEKIKSDKFMQYKEIINKFDIDKVGDNYIILEARRKKDKIWLHYTDHTMSDWDERWLLFTPDGKIKYDSIILKHPIHIALESVPVLLTSDNEKLENRIYESLEQMGIPMFELDLSANARKRLQSLLKMRQWLLKEGDKWDSSEPKVFFPKQLLREYK